MFYYLDYENVQKRLESLVKAPSGKIPVIKEKPLGFTDYLLPIEHYTMGFGKKHIIVCGSYHGAEIITTIFIIHLMEALALNGGFNPEEYTIHFIPIINPEGYLITTSMQNLYLAQGKTAKEKILLARKYWQIYKQDALNNHKAKIEGDIKTLRSPKDYQTLYEQVSEKEFLKNYLKLKEQVLKLIKENNLPLGVCAAWSSNGQGIDLSQNVPFNHKIEEYKKEPQYGNTVYTNIRSDIPGPINCPARDLNNFTFEKENLHLLNFLLELEAKEEIVAFFNYHSVMGKMYQRPVQDLGMISLYNIDWETKIIENYISARLFKEKNGYDIIEEKSPYNYINEYIRLRFGINIQIELSKMSANPIGPLGDPNSFWEETIKSNIEGFKNFMKNIDFIKEYTAFIKTLAPNIKGLDVNELYRLIDNELAKEPSMVKKLKK